MRRRRASPEAQIQRAVVQHLKIRGAPNMVFFHIPSGGYRRPIEAAIFKGLGAMPGLPDLCLIWRGKPYFLELKADGGRLSDNQKRMLEMLYAAGATAGVATGLDQALNWLEVHGLLKGRAA